MYTQPPPHQDARSQNGAAPHNGTMPQQPPTYPPRRPRGRIPALALGAYGAGVLGIVLAAVTLALFLTYKSQTTAQLGQVRHELATTQANLAKAQADNSTKYAKMIGTVTGIGNEIAPYNMVCSQDLTGANGPAQFWLPCSDAKP